MKKKPWTTNNEQRTNATKITISIDMWPHNRMAARPGAGPPQPRLWSRLARFTAWHHAVAFGCRCRGSRPRGTGHPGERQPGGSQSLGQRRLRNVHPTNEMPEGPRVILTLATTGKLENANSYTHGTAMHSFDRGF